MTRAPTEAVPSGFFVLRTPLLPLDDFLGWGRELEVTSADVPKLRERLGKFLALPEVQEAIFVASPDLFESLHIWNEYPESERGQKVERTLVRYFSRMTGRATPFGLFAGCSVGAIGDQTHLRVVGRNAYLRHTRLDMEYVSKLSEAFARIPALRQVLVYRPNSSLYRAAGRLRYAEGRTTDDGRSYHLVAFDNDVNIDAALAHAEGGAQISELASTLLELNPQASQEEADAFVQRMIDRQMLLPDLDPAVTGPEPLPHLAEKLRAHPDFEGAADRLEQTAQLLARLDGTGLRNNPDTYRCIAALLGDLPAPVHLPRLFQVDMVKPSPSATLDKAVIAELLRGVDMLRGLFAHEDFVDLKNFRSAFEKRYGQREVPLVEALDDEMGIGFGIQPGRGLGVSPLLQNVDLPAPSQLQTYSTARHAFLLRKLGEALANRRQVLELAPDELEGLAPGSLPDLPDSFSVTAVLAASADAPATDFQVYLSAISGPSGVSLLGRFCHADPALHERVALHLRDEEAARGDACFAEIVHLPEGRIGNVIARPVLRGYEIPYLGSSGTPEEKQISVNDLWVSVTGGCITLRSKRLGCEIIPRMATAHNFASKSVGIYRFLCSLQFQNSATGSWNWGPLDTAPFLPRVTVGRVVLSLARWNLSEEQLQGLAGSTPADRFLAAQKLRQSIQLPRFVGLADSDSVLRIDLDNLLSVEAFVHLVKGRTSARLVEDFPGGDRLCAAGPEGRFVHELIVPFVRKVTPQNAEISRPNRLAPSRIVQRSHPPGGEWLYAKLYTGTSNADRVLTALEPVISNALSSGAAERWFFIRYGDPDWHLRLRFQGAPRRLLEEVLPALHKTVAPLLDDGRVWRFQLDTYEREMERYGGTEGMELAEQMFEADSEAALALVPMVSRDAGADARWRLVLRGMDLLLGDLGLDPFQKLTVVKQLRESFGKEFQIDRRVKHQLGEKFRIERSTLEQFLGDGDELQSLKPALDILRGRSEKMIPIARALQAREAAGLLTVSLMELAGSFLHMQANRMLRSDHREQELVIYDLLVRLYESRLARTRFASGASAARS